MPPISTGWPTSRSGSGRSGWPGPKARVAPLRWTKSRRDAPSDAVLLDLAGVVRDVVEQRQLAPAARRRANDLRARGA